jgi:DNA-binding transcriptional ArsR family regulator
MIPAAYRAAEMIDRGVEFTGGDLARASGMPKDQASEHIRKLLRQGVIRRVAEVHKVRIYQSARAG